MNIEPLNKETLEDSINLLYDSFQHKLDHLIIQGGLRCSMHKDKIFSRILLRTYGVIDLEYYITKSEDDKVVGITGLYSRRKDSNEALWLGWFAVHPNYRKKGIGNKLLQFSIDEAKKRGKKYLRLYTSTAKSEQDSHNLYEKVGFKKIKEEGNILYYELKLN